MDVKRAVITAKQFIQDLLKDEGIVNLGLEEVEFDEKSDTWRVTLGFSRAWNSDRGPLSTLSGDDLMKRDYKVVTISDVDGSMVSIRKPEYVMVAE